MSSKCPDRPTIGCRLIPRVGTRLPPRVRLSFIPTCLRARLHGQVLRTQSRLLTMADLPVKRRKVPPKTDNEKAVTQASEQTKAKARTRKAAPKEVDATTAKTATAERTIRRATSGPKQPKASMVPKDRLAADSSVSAPTAAKKVASSATGVHESASPGLTRPSKPLAESVGLAAGPVRKTQASLQRAGGQVVPPNAVLPAPAFVPRQSSSESAWNNGPRGAGSQSAFPPHVTYKGASRRYRSPSWRQACEDGC